MLQTFLENATAVGYEALIEKYHLQVIPHYRKSFILSKGAGKTIIQDHVEIHAYPKQYLPVNPEDPIQQLEFALKYDGINLEIIGKVFKQLSQKAIESYIKSRPTGKTARRLWYLYEFLENRLLNLPDAKGGAYLPLLDSAIYYTAAPQRSRRHLIDDNLLGNRDFSPIVRKTDTLQQFEKKHLDNVAQQLIAEYQPDIIARAINYLYMKEIMSSYEIERERPDQKRATRFMNLLREIPKYSLLTKETFITLQNEIVDPRFRDSDYRHYQNYIGEQKDAYRQMLHYISPKPEDVASLMQGLIDSFDKLAHSRVHPVIIAATIAFGFVFIHPFEDGNGRIHRFLIHFILSKLKYTPEGTIFPVSSIILKDLKAYDQILERFSIPLMQLIRNYTLTDKGELTVEQSTREFYQSLDYTPYVEYLFHCIEKTIQTDFREELDYLANYDRAFKEIQNIVDMPDKMIDLYIRFTLQNHGQLSENKRAKYFPMLTDAELSSLEKVMTSYFQL